MPVAADLVADLARVLLDEERARAGIREALRRQADLLRQLRVLGVTVTSVAHRLAVARGEALPVAGRLRLARRLRKRAERETARRLDLAQAVGLITPATPPSGWAITPVQKEDHMPQILKRTVTVEEFVDADIEEKDEDQEEQESEESDDADEEPTKRKRTSRAR